MERWVRPTTYIESIKLKRMLGTRIILASETFQTTGSFKFRAAWQVANTVSNSHIITASSGNFGQALACACDILGKKCTVVMPDTSAQVKIKAVESFDATVRLIDTAAVTRKQAVTELALKYPDAYVASAYDDPLVITGNSTLGYELASLRPAPDVFIVPIGGGGLSSGIVRGLYDASFAGTVIGAEPVLANDAARSLRAGKIIANEQEPKTIADGARTLSLGKHNWEILKNGLRTIVEVSESNIRLGVRMLFYLANLKVEPTGALALAAILEKPDLFDNALVCCVISGGNVDKETYSAMLVE